MPKSNLVHLTTKLKASTYDALHRLAKEQFDGYVSVAARALLERALEGGEISNEDRGYQDGVKRGLHDVHEAIRTKVASLWERSK